MKSFANWFNEEERLLSESDTRYSIEINFRTKTDEVLKNAAKITLGFVSASLKKADFHVKQVFEEDPIRILVSSRNWDDGTWVSMVSWNKEHKCYVIAKGFYNKMRRTITLQGSPKKCEADNASEIVNQTKNLMHELKNKPDQHTEKLKRVPLKRGPK